ncbi:MAG: hypothetical protein IZT56_09760 [Bacteroidetes bacterium]|nr:hypothetical protein [Bacteroidota bacterium]
MKTHFNSLNIIFLAAFLFILSSCGEDSIEPYVEETIEEEEEEVIEPVYEKIYFHGSGTIFNSYALKNYLDENFSTMYYYAEKFNADFGGSYILEYVDEGGSGMDSYPNVTIGGVKSGGSWISGDKNTVGMPTQIKDISNTLSFEWETSQINGRDDDDKWMASINFIFDNYGTETSEPNNANRDYDLVVMHQYHRFDDSVDDKPIGTSTTHWYFARNIDGSLKPYELEIDGKKYGYAVRYKFFINAGDKNNKAHVKFIPFENSELPPVLKVNVKNIINASKNLMQYANIPAEYLELAKNNIALDNAWLKSINAGYEVYTGNSTLKIDKFKIEK